MDIQGALVGAAAGAASAPLLLPSAEACRQACCDAPACHGFSFALSDLRISTVAAADCFLYVNITQLVPASVMTSGLREAFL